MKKTKWEKRRDNAAARIDKYENLVELAVAEKAWADVERFALLGYKAEQEYDLAVSHVGRLMQRRQHRLYELYPPPRVTPEYEDDDDDDDGESAVEWEFGFEYESDSGPSSNVDVNFRVWRVDGQAFGMKEARAAMKYVRENRGNAPTGYRVTGIDWRNPPRPWRDNNSRGVGVDKVIDDLINVLDAVDSAPGLWNGPWRMGAVKR